jgi:MoaA/NifB/PqqE/SkfB family radical SAM enzyme
MRARELFYYLKYGFFSLILRRHAPLVAGAALTDVCNLSCAHCVVANKGRGPYTFTRILEIFNMFYNRGARILYIQGGEIMTWKDGDKNVNDVIKAARDAGFFKVAAVTNGTFPVDINPDAVWVSLDGPEKMHDEIRGKGSFALTIKNIRDAKHPNISANVTVNRKNMAGIAELIKFVSSEKNFKGISINFHTPYPGVEGLALDKKEREAVLKDVIRLKKEGLRVLNSFYGLKKLMTGRYKRPVFMIQLMEMDRVFECCWGKDDPGVCEKCGYGIIPELSGIESLNPAAIIGALNLFKGIKK